MERGGGVRKSGPQHRGPSPKHWPQGLSVCRGPSMVCVSSVCAVDMHDYVCRYLWFVTVSVSSRHHDYVDRATLFGFCLFVCACHVSVYLCVLAPV